MLSLMGEGRLTEQGSGKVADYTQTVIILTSNAEHETIGKLSDQIDDQHELGNAVRSVLKESNTFRPEIISRFDNIYVFKPLDDVTNARIAGLKIAKAGEEYGVKIDHIAKEIVYDIVTTGDDIQDARELTRLVDAKLGEILLKARENGMETVTISIDDDGQPCICNGHAGDSS